jgi:hypothetical protein
LDLLGDHRKQQDARRFIGGLIFLVDVKNGWC